jgi:hypothetical protein
MLLGTMMGVLVLQAAFGRLQAKLLAKVGPLLQTELIFV